MNDCALPGDKPGRWCTGDLGHSDPHADQDGQTWNQRDVSQPGPERSAK